MENIWRWFQTEYNKGMKGKELKKGSVNIAMKTDPGPYLVK